MTSRLRTLIVLVFITVSIAAAGCGDNGGRAPTAKALDAAASHAATPDGKTDAASGSTTTSTPKAAVRATTTTAGPAASSAAGATPTSVPAKQPPPIVGTPDHACVHAGDVQGLTVRGGDPATYVIYDSVYSNRTDDFTTHYGTGSGKGLSGPDAVYHDTWVLAPNVPAGQVIVQFATTWQHHIVKWYTTFDIKPKGTAC